MIIWINGSFGSGKTSVAHELNKMIEQSYLYDPEEVGQFLMKNMPRELQKSDFQDHQLWRTVNFDVLKYIDQEYDGTIIVPMTLVSEEYYKAIVAKLKERDIEIRMFTLLASYETLTERLIKRGEIEGAWAFQQVERCVAGLKNTLFREHIKTDDMSIREVAEHIVKQCME